MNYDEAIAIIREHVPEPKLTELCVWLEALYKERKIADDPICPNCSLPGKPFYLSPVPPDFVEIMNATHECTKCEYKTRHSKI